MELNKDIFMAFEVEDTYSHERMIYMYDPNRNCVAFIYSTNRQFQLYQLVDKNFPWLCKDAYEYFKCLYKKSIAFNANMIKFLHWLDPRTLQPFPKTSQ